MQLRASKLLFLILLFTSIIGFSEIKIGVLLPLTGQYSSYGSTAKKGVELAYSEKNSVKGQKVTLIFLDTQGDPEITKNVAVRLIERENVVAILGEILHKNTIELVEVCEKYKVPLITAIPIVGVTKGTKYINRISYDNYLQGVVIAEFLHATMKVKKLAILSDKLPYGEELSQYLSEHFKQIGGNVLKLYYDPKSRVFTSYIVSTMEYNPEAVFISGYYDSAVRLIQEFKISGYNGIFVSGNFIEVPEIYNKAYDNLLYTTGFNRWSLNENTKNFVKNFEKQYNGELTTYLSALYYDAYMIILNAYEKFDVKNRKDLAEAIRKTVDYKGVTGNITIDALGERRLPVTFNKIVNGLPKFIGISSDKIFK